MSGEPMGGLGSHMVDLTRVGVPDNSITRRLHSRRSVALGGP